MANDRKKTLDALRIAVQMEIDGKEYYIKASQASSNSAGRKFLKSLSEAEDIHRQKFIQIYESVRDKNAWPRAFLSPGANKHLKTIFSTATERMAARTNVLKDELDAVQLAIKKESQTFDFYTKRSAKATGEAEKTYYSAIADEEREHHLALSDYYEFLKNPAGWFFKHEHPSIDGG